VLANWHFNVVDKAALQPTVDQEFADPKAELDFVPGDYAATAWRVNSGGEVFGEKVSADFSVPVPPVGDAAGSLTVTLV